MKVAQQLNLGNFPQRIRRGVSSISTYPSFPGRHLTQSCTYQSHRGYDSRADLPKANTEAVFARMKTERNRISNRYICEGEGESQSIGRDGKRTGSDKVGGLSEGSGDKGKGDAEAVPEKASSKKP